MNRKENYDKEELLYTLRDLIIGGTDTSMNTLLWAMIMLANNPKVQSSIREEIDSVVPRTRLPSLDDKPNLPYTEASMTELMRWRSLHSTRTSSADYVRHRGQWFLHTIWNAGECDLLCLQ